ncbi:hypothetical protein RB595_002317 [Gaeumannomyces hyphopodioides]
MIPAPSVSAKVWTAPTPSTKPAPVVVDASDPPSPWTNLNAKVASPTKRYTLPPHPDFTTGCVLVLETDFSRTRSAERHDTSPRRRGPARCRLHPLMVLAGLLVFVAGVLTPVAAISIRFTAMGVLPNCSGLLAATGSLAVPILSTGTANPDESVAGSFIIGAYAICGLGYSILLFLALRERVNAHARRFFVLVTIVAGFVALESMGTYGGLSGIDGLKILGPLSLGLGLLFASVWTAIFGTGAAAIINLASQPV